MKPLFKKGQRLQYMKDCQQNEQVQILKVYPIGHKYANATSNFYLVDSSHSGQDVWSESAVLDGLDLFYNPFLLPKKVENTIIKFGEFSTYEKCEQLLKILNNLGYTFQYYLDAMPYNLTKI